jgi:hypothetical protein
VQHGLDTVHELIDLQQYMTAIELKADQMLPWENEKHHGLFFIEYGHLRIEHSADYTNTNRTFPSSASSPAAAPTRMNQYSNVSIGHLNARSGTMGRQTAMWKVAKQGQAEQTEQNFRLARVGQGWVVGMIENCSGMRRTGIYISG